MTRDIRADVEQNLTQQNGRKPTSAELNKAIDFVTLYLQAGKGTQELIAEILEVTAKLLAQGKSDEAIAYAHRRIKEAKGVDV